jgi:hypothetical protein
VARHPEWFERLETIIEVVREAEHLQWLGRNEIAAIFECGERDSIRLLHKFGAEQRANVLTLARPALLLQLEAIRAGSTFAAFSRQRQEIARQLTIARAEAAARQFRVQATDPGAARARLQDLPGTITWRRNAAGGKGRFEIQYDDGGDLMRQLAAFLIAAGVNREEFLAGTEPPDGA